MVRFKGRRNHGQIHQQFTGIAPYIYTLYCCRPNQLSNNVIISVDNKHARQLYRVPENTVLTSATVYWTRVHVHNTWCK